jgi:hypothetical protein
MVAPAGAEMVGNHQIQIRREVMAHPILVVAVVVERLALMSGQHPVAQAAPVLSFSNTQSLFLQ